MAKSAKKNSVQDITLRRIRELEDNDFGDASEDYKKKRFDWLASQNFLHKKFFLDRFTKKYKWEDS